MNMMSTQKQLAGGLSGKIQAKRDATRASLAVPGRIDVPVVTAIVAVVLGYAWTQRNEGHITAEYGIGYWLGITGATMMLLLLLYPLRKRIRFLLALAGRPGRRHRFPSSGGHHRTVVTAGLAAARTVEAQVALLAGNHATAHPPVDVIQILGRPQRGTATVAEFQLLPVEDGTAK